MMEEILKIEKEFKEYLDGLKIPPKKLEAIMIKHLEIVEKYIQLYKK